MLGIVLCAHTSVLVALQREISRAPLTPTHTHTHTHVPALLSAVAYKPTNTSPYSREAAEAFLHLHLLHISASNEERQVVNGRG